jgi:hypothetical protein
MCGGPAAKWFSDIDPETEPLYSRRRWNAQAITWVGRLVGVPMPAVEHVRIRDVLPIARWMAETLRAGQVPHLWASPSSAVKICETAESAAEKLEGARFTVTGEPVTAARLDVIRRVGACASPDYGSVDAGGSAGCGCLSPEAPDDIHVFSDLNAVIHADAGPFPPDALLLTSIRRSAPFFLLNVSMGDQAVISHRSCGCPVADLGWDMHLHTIRSYEKLSAGGVTFEDTDVIAILEEILPRRFGGGPTDYQLVEEIADGGSPRLRLRVHPSLGPLEPGQVSDLFFKSLGAGSPGNRMMALHLQQGNFLSVERKPPHATASGKILHLWAAQE